MKVKLIKDYPGKEGEVALFYGVGFKFSDGWFAELDTEEAKAMIDAGRVEEIKGRKRVQS